VKHGLAKTDPVEYVKLLKEHVDDHSKWLISSKVLAEAVDKSPALLNSIESLANENFVPAKILLCKLGIIKQDPEQFEKHLNSCPSDLQLSSYGGVFDNIDTTEKLDMVLAVLKKNNAENNILEAVSNNFKHHSEPKANLNPSSN